MKGDECQKYLSHKYNSCKLLCMLILMCLVTLFSPVTYSNDQCLQSVNIPEGLSKQLEDSLLLTEKEGRLRDFYIRKESEYRDSGKYGEIIDMSNWIERHISADNVDNLSLIYELRSSAYSAIGDYDAMFEDIEKALDISKDENYLFRDGIIYLRLMDFHLMFKSLDLAQLYLDKMVQVSDKHYNSEANKEAWQNLNFLIHVSRGQFYRVQKEWDLAIAEYNKAEKYILGERHLRGLNIQKFLLYKDRGDYELADSVYQNNLDGGNKLPFFEFGPIRMEYAILLLEMGKTDASKAELRLLPPDSIHLTQRSDLYGLLSRVYKEESNYPLAYHYLQKSIYLRDSLEGEYRKAYAKHAADRFEVRQVEKSLEKQRGENIKKTIFIAFLIGVVIILVVWGIIVLIRQRRRKREQAIVENHLGNRNAALSSAVIAVDNYKNICDEIKEIMESDESTENKFTGIRRILKGTSNTVEPLHQVSNANHEVMMDFVDKLRYVHTDLTNAELRMAQFVMMNLSNKDIAKLLKRSVGTIKNQKYSLRKKLDTNLSTEDYLKHISAASSLELEELANAVRQK